MNENFWKDAYKDTWAQSSDRENWMIEFIKRETGKTAVDSGLGAGTDTYINGSAKTNGYEKVDADLHILGTNIYVEVTGPLKKSVPEAAPLWFRPDKLNNAIKNREIHDTFLAHHCPSTNRWRIIHVDARFIDRCYNREFKVVNPIIRGNRERYVEILTTDRAIRGLDFLIDYIRSK